MRSLFVCLFALSLAADAGAQSPKLTSVLADLVRASATAGSQTSLAIDSMPRSVQDAVRARRLRIDANNEVQVYILLSAVTDETVAQLTDAGVTIEIRDAERRRVQAHLPVSRLNAVAGLAAVDSIRLPTYARRRAGNAVTEGDAILFADAVRTQLSLDGTGIRVGVISDGLKGVFATTACAAQCGSAVGGPISTGDLPASVGVRNASGVLTSSGGGIVGRSFQANADLEGLPPATPACAFPGAGGEGTALLEIVHDLAPGAKLSFANFDTDLAFNQAVNFLAASNDIVLDDIGFLGEPYDGTSGVSQNTAAALNNPDFPIRAYFTSVGNDADEHYIGAYTPSGVDGASISGVANPGRLHLFQRTADTTDVLGLGPQPYNVVALPPNGEIAIFLTWNDPFGGSANNYDLYLVQQSTGRVVASSTDVQSGRQDPVEVIDYINRTGQQDLFRIVVQNVRDTAQPRDLNIFSFQPECAATGPLLLASGSHERHNFNTATRSVSAQSDAGGSPVSVVSVGAICSASANAAGGGGVPNESCLDTTNRTAEFFSSRGPTVDGRPKPDIAAIDGVSVTGAGGFPSTFFGTSAAAPHMGGIAALLLQGAPCLLNRSTSTIGAASARSTVRNLLLANAVKLSSNSPDNVFGAGRADAFSSLRATLPVWRGSGPTLAFDANSTFGVALTPAQLGFTDPNSCPLTALTWTGGCGTSPGTVMTCPAGTNAVTVSASNNNFAFGATADVQIVVSDFTVDVAPPATTLAAGASSTHTVTITPQNGAYNTEITLGCATGNLPPQTTCTFNPPTVTPGGSAVRSTMTVSTTARTGSTTTSAVTIPPAPRAIAPRAAGSGLALFPGTLGFGTQTIATTSPPQFLSLTNIGTGALAVSSISISGDFTAVNNCGTTVAVGAVCSIAVTFTPTAAGTRTGTVSVVDDAAGSPHTITLTGTGQTAPSSTGGTPAGSYTIGVSGTVGTLSHFGTVILTVQ